MVRAAGWPGLSVRVCWLGVQAGPQGCTVLGLEPVRSVAGQQNDTTGTAQAPGAEAQASRVDLMPT